MTDITSILGGPWALPPTKEKNTAPPETQLSDAMVSAGITPPPTILLDGKIHRFKSGTKGKPGKSDKAGWYVAFGDGVPAGRFGCFRAGIEQAWRADIGRELSAEETQQHVRRQAEAQSIRDAAAEKRRESAANTVDKIWTNATPAHTDHPYLQRKKIGVHGARTTGDGRLIVPLYDATGTLSSLQYIDSDGGKRYHPGGATTGRFWSVGPFDDPGILYIAEGFATAATIHEVTDRPVIIAYSASNLVPATGAVRDLYGASQDIVIVADNDASGIGLRYAEQASAKYGARIIPIPIAGDANDYVANGHDLASLLTPPAVSDWLISADEFSKQPIAISWLIKKWVQENALLMVHGPSGCGKTFVVLDWCLRIASTFNYWCGQIVKEGTIVYLAGEGHHGLRGRIAAWKQYNKIDSVQLWISKAGCDLNTKEGYKKVVEHIKTLKIKPKMIVVDTLHRFLFGDENSSQDVKTMLDACAMLMFEFGCSILLVHHTGVSEEAQHRARGSSAWRGALDIEVSIVPGKRNHPIEITQRKSKDSELAPSVFVELQSVAIDGWFDEDGEQVTSAVVVQVDAPITVKKDSKLDQFRKTFENAWLAAGKEVREGSPYLSRSALLNYLTSNDGLSEATARTYVTPGKPGRLISDLLTAQIIQMHDVGHGWVVICQTHKDAMLLI